ncbi:MAG: SurA N-terminal domain-containing protein [Alphaproteobacteria bacterium]
MLGAMRKSAKSWVMKAILGLLALTFVAFFGGVGGFGGFSTGGHGGGRAGSVGNLNSLVQVGNIDIDANAISTAYNQELRSLSQLLGTAVSPEQARQLGLLNRTVDRLIAGALFDQGAEDLGVSISEQSVALAVRSLPQFQAAGGGFDAATYESFLRFNNIVEGQFLADVRSDLSRRQVLGTIQASATAPFALVDAIYNYRQEQRIIETVHIGAIDLPDLSEPTDGEVSAYYESAKNQFLAPEYRSIAIATLSTEQLAEQLTPDENELRIDFELRQGEFNIPEVRAIKQTIFADREAAERARKLITDGQSFDDATQEVTGSAPLDLGQLARADLLPELADVTFTLAAAAVSDPVESPFGWHLMLVTEIIPEDTPTFEDVREQLARDRASIMARDQIFEVMDTVTDAYAGGASLEDAVQENGLHLRNITAVAANGTDTSDSPVDGLDPEGLMLRIAFATNTGQDSDVVETRDGGFFVLRVSGITEPAPRPLDNVREEVAAAWQTQQISEGAKNLADQLVDRVAGGEDLADAASALGLTADLSEPVLRTGEGAQLPPTLIDLAFEGDIADISVTPDGEGVVVGRVAEILPASGAGALVSLRTELTRDVGVDIQTQLAAALRNSYDVDIDEAALDRLFQQGQQQPLAPAHQR